MIHDFLEFAKRCHVCQYHGKFIKTPPEPLYSTSQSWPFVAWGIDIVGPFENATSRGCKYIVAVTDYFSKWAEAITVKDFVSTMVAEFIRIHIVYRFGVPETITADNGQQFKRAALYKLYDKYRIKRNHSSWYYAPANGLAKAFNKTLCTILKKMVDKNKKVWPERLPEALWPIGPLPGQQLSLPHTSWSLGERLSSRWKYSSHL